jgi:hypothetical protein
MEINRERTQPGPACHHQRLRLKKQQTKRKEELQKAAAKKRIKIE